ncbi:MAG: P-II family nitrogen regulator [Alphaproteobacteria bacterium]|nr:P-II family nitrogen regulator [Alphaproteobacteria bacterium]
MDLKMIMALVADEKTDTVLEAAREAGATGATVITSVRGEGLEPVKTFLGLEVASQRDILLFLVAAPLAREILETIATAGRFDEEPGSGIAFQVSIEDAVGLSTQEGTILQEIEDSI